MECEMLKKYFYAKNLLASLFMVLFTTQLVFSQPAEKPYWVINLNIKNPDSHYFGIGQSDKSQEEADDRARVAFAKNVSVSVESMTKSFLAESDQEIRDEFEEQSKVTADIKLRGISISKRWRDKNNNIFYSLIQYTKDEYRKIYQSELKAELDQLKQKNISKEKKRREKIRHDAEMAKLKAAQKEKELQLQRERDLLEQKERRATREHEQHLLATRGDFIRMPAPLKMLDLRNAELAAKTHEISFSAVLGPFDLGRAAYTFYWKYFSAGFNVSKNIKTFALQESFLKIRVLSGEKRIYHTSLALGVNQLAHHIANFEHFDKDHIDYSLFLAGNVSLPQLYLHSSIFVDRRKLALGFNYYPLFNQFKGKLEVILQSELIYDPDYRTRFDDQFLFQPGLRFAVDPDFFSVMVSYERNEFVTFTFDLVF